MGVVRVLDSSWDEYPTLLEAFRSAERMARTFHTWVSVYDSHGFVATIYPEEK